jgi:hypothetical protein
LLERIAGRETVEGIGRERRAFRTLSRSPEVIEPREPRSGS